MSPSRPSWQRYFMDIARLTATRATCPRAQVGCVLVKNNRIIATGYNGSPPDAKHCSDAGCFLHEGHCVRSVHAEANALANAAKYAGSIQGAHAFVTHSPCVRCYNLLTAAGVQYVGYGEEYGTDLDVIQSLTLQDLTDSRPWLGKLGPL